MLLRLRPGTRPISSATRGIVSEVGNLDSSIHSLEQNLDSSSVSAFISLLKRCIHERALPQVRRLEELVLRAGHSQNPFVANLILQAYRKCGEIHLALSAFNNLHCRSVHSWTIIIGALAQSSPAKAFHLFREMELEGMKPSLVTYVALLGTVSDPKLVPQGREIHHRVSASGLECNVILFTALMNMYAKAGELEQARSFFDRAPERNLITWTNLISAYAQHGRGREAIEVFDQLLAQGLTPDEITLVSVVDACSGAEDLSRGREIHQGIQAWVWESNTTLANALITMYSRCGSLSEARFVFDRVQNPNLTSWNCMLTGYSSHGESSSTLELFESLIGSRLEPNHVSFLSVISACMELGDEPRAADIHRRILEQGGESSRSLSLSNALMNMYSRFGRVEKVSQIFHGLEHRNVVTWTSMITAVAGARMKGETMALFRGMQLEGVRPDSIAFVSVMFACNHEGLLDECVEIYRLMVGEYELRPKAEHWSCVVDVVGRSGKLEEGEEMMREMSGGGDSPLLWMALLSACNTQGDLERGKAMAERALDLEPGLWGAYVMLSNLYSQAD